jgi:hypothetical protein
MSFTLAPPAIMIVTGHSILLYHRQLTIRCSKKPFSSLLIIWSFSEIVKLHVSVASSTFFTHLGISWSHCNISMWDWCPDNPNSKDRQLVCILEVMSVRTSSLGTTFPKCQNIRSARLKEF